MGRLALLLAAAFAIGTDVPRDSLGFSEGVVPIEPGPLPTNVDSLSECESCHQTASAEHRDSAHARSWSNPVFQQAYRLEPGPRCKNCHSLATTGERTGISCIACHVRDGVVLTSRVPPTETPHPSRVDPALTDGTLCKGCHEFSFRTTPLAMQSTYSEWESYRSGGGDGTCVSCHMHKGHGVRGGHDLDLVRQSLRIRVRETDQLELELSTVGVGHAFPTGDIFRTLSIEVAPPHAPGVFRTVARIGRHFNLTGTPRLLADESLHPGRPRTVALGAAESVENLRLRYHYAPGTQVSEGSVPAEKLIAVVFQGPLGTPTPNYRTWSPR